MGFNSGFKGLICIPFITTCFLYILPRITTKRMLFLWTSNLVTSSYLPQLLTSLQLISTRQYFFRLWAYFAILFTLCDKFLLHIPLKFLYTNSSHFSAACAFTFVRVFMCLYAAYMQACTGPCCAEGGFHSSFNLDSQNTFLHIII